MIEALNTSKLERRFWKKVNSDFDWDKCWEWKAGKDNEGYGVIRVSSKVIRAHVLSYELHFYEVPKGLHVLHECDNPPCVNPHHLKLGTHLDNMKDMLSKGRFCKGEQSPKSKLTEEDVLDIRAMYESGDFTQVQISDIFHVSNMLVSLIVRRIMWKHI